MRFIRNSKYSTQFVCLLILAVTAMLCISLVNALLLKQSILDERKQVIRAAVDIAYQTLATEASRSERGELDQAAAQQQAIETVNEMRYAGEEYFFIHSTDMIAIMTPGRPDMIGKDMSDVRDPNGKFIVRALLDVINKQQAGFVEYSWPKAGTDDPVPKLSYIREFEPWGWMIGTGLYMDDIDSAFYERLMISMAILATFTLLMIALVALMLRNAHESTNSILQRLKALSSADQAEPLQVDENTPENEMGLILRSLADTQSAMLQRMTARHEETKRIKEALDLARSPVLLANADARIQYANLSAQELFVSLKPDFKAHCPHFAGGELLSLSLDQLHPHPRQLIEQLDNLSSTLTEELELGDRHLKVVKTPVMDESVSNRCLGIVVEWEDLTEQHEHERRMLAESQMEREKAQAVKQRVDEVLAVVGAASEGDLSKDISIGGNDEVGLMATSLREFLNRLRSNLGTIGKHANSMTDTAGLLASVGSELSENTIVTSTQASTASASAKNISTAVDSVAAASEQMSASIREIAENTTQAANIAQKAVELAGSTDTSVRQLAESSSRISQVIKVITSIAEQTNLLALNATIEAARAGDAGKGFAVVANEVKELAKETARATEDIEAIIVSIQMDTQSAVGAISEIGDTVNEINTIQSTIAKSVEEQMRTSLDISSSVQSAATDCGEVAQNVLSAAGAASSSREAAEQSSVAVDGLGSMASELQGLVRYYKIA